MEETKSNEENTQEEIKLLTFDPHLMQDEIKKLRNEVTSLKEENSVLRKESLARCIQNLLLELFGGRYIDKVEVKSEKKNSI